jgi:hypothetical protein
MPVLVDTDGGAYHLKLAVVMEGSSDHIGVVSTHAARHPETDVCDRQRSIEARVNAWDFMVGFSVSGQIRVGCL